MWNFFSTTAAKNYKAARGHKQHNWRSFTIVRAIGRGAWARVLTFFVHYHTRTAQFRIYVVFFIAVRKKMRENTTKKNCVFYLLLLLLLWFVYIVQKAQMLMCRIDFSNTQRQLYKFIQRRVEHARNHICIHKHCITFNHIRGDQFWGKIYFHFILAAQLLQFWVCVAIPTKVKIWSEDFLIYLMNQTHALVMTEWYKIQN